MVNRWAYAQPVGEWFMMVSGYCLVVHNGNVHWLIQASLKDIQVGKSGKCTICRSCIYQRWTLFVAVLDHHKPVIPMWYARLVRVFILCLHQSDVATGEAIPRWVFVFYFLITNLAMENLPFIGGFPRFPNTIWPWSISRLVYQRIIFVGGRNTPDQRDVRRGFASSSCPLWLGGTWPSKLQARNTDGTAVWMC